MPECRREAAFRWADCVVGVGHLTILSQDRLASDRFVDGFEPPISPKRRERLTAGDDGSGDGNAHESARLTADFGG